MGDAFPSFFYSRDPLPEKVKLISLKNDKQDKSDKFYWMLSVEDNLQGNEFRTALSGLAPYEDNENEMVDCYDLEDNYEINPTKSGKYITSFYVPSALHSVIIGARGTKLRELQDNTNTLIKVPKSNEEGLVKITGSSERSVASARTQVALLILSKREKLSVTHFVSIPMYSETIKKNFLKFQNDILGAPATRGIDETIFQKPEKFHLTVVTCALLDEKEIAEASQILEKCQSSIRRILSNKKPKIVLKGVEIMNDDPSEVDVLYGKVFLDHGEDSKLLQEVVDEIFEVFSGNGLVRKQYDHVKLHVTLMNSLFRKDDGFQRKGSSSRETFDASYILDQYKYYYFGKTVLETVHLSIRFTSNKYGYYDSAATIST